MTTERIETRNAQAKVIALPEGDLIVGHSRLEKPRTDSAGRTLPVLTKFYEYDTQRTFLWFGSSWRLIEPTLADVLTELRSITEGVAEATRELRRLTFGMGHMVDADLSAIE